MIRVHFVTAQQAREGGCFSALTAEDREKLRLMKNPREADLRAFLWLKSREIRAQGRAVSLSHSDEWGAWAEADDRTTRVGVDAETWANHGGIAEVLLVKNHRISHDDALACWVLGEAVYKAGAGDEWHPANWENDECEKRKQRLVAEGWEFDFWRREEGLAAVVWRDREGEFFEDDS